MSEEKVEWNTEGVQAHLTILQSVIQRMASNSASNKAWCIALVSAILFTVGNTTTNNPKLALVALAPTLLFFFLDAYYLTLEKQFRKSYNLFIGKLHKRKIEVDDLYAITPQGDFWLNFGASVLSPSVWPFYVTMLLVIFLSLLFILPH